MQMHYFVSSFCIEFIVIGMVKFVRKDKGGGGKSVYLYIVKIEDSHQILTAFLTFLVTIAHIQLERSEKGWFKSGKGDHKLSTEKLEDYKTIFGQIIGHFCSVLGHKNRDYVGNEPHYI